jgi:hypothetical protein
MISASSSSPSFSSHGSSRSIAPPSAERDSEALSPTVEELDREPAIDDRPTLSRELMHPLLGEDPRPVGIHIAAGGVAQRPG